MRYIGGHVSAAGGVEKAPQRAKKIGANCMQLFGGSPVRWNATLPSEKTVEIFKKECEKHGIGRVFLHAPYLINLASPKKNIRALSLKLLSLHATIGERLGVDGVIFHIGSRGDMEEKEAHNIIVSAVQRVLSETKEVMLLMENTAGAGNLVGESIEELSLLYKRLDSDRIGVCIDTAHAFASGIIGTFSKKDIDLFFSKIEKGLGINSIRAIHLNDSKTEAGSKKDRHENIGEGKIGEKNIQRFLKRKEIKEIPLILEVPGYRKEGPDKKNINKVKLLI